MAQNITLLGASYSDVPAVELPKTGGGTASFTDVTDTTAAAADVATGKYFYTAAGVRTEGTATGGGGGAIVVTDTTDVHGGTIREITAVDISSDTVTAGDMLYGVTAHDGEGNAITGTIATKTAADLTASGDTVTVPAGYYASNETKAVASGSATTPATTITANPSISVNTSTGVITATASATQSVTPTVSAGYVSSGTAGTITVSGSNTSSLSTVSGTTITPTTSEQTAVAANKYTLGAVKVAAMPSGTAGTPTATKGTVSNHSVTVTPSVTNTTGYITGSTKTGTAVTVSASELVSGSETKTENGTYDVTNLASLVVNVSGGGGSVSYDTKTATASNYPVSLQFTSMKGEPKAFVCRLNAQVSSSGSTTYYYIVDICAFGTTTHGNCFRIGNTRRVDNITSGYSWSYSGTTLTITSSASSRSASPGAFYSGSYELLYAY